MGGDVRSESIVYKSKMRVGNRAQSYRNSRI